MKKNTFAYSVLQDAKNRIEANAKTVVEKKKLSEMNDAEKVEYYKSQLSKEKKKNKELTEKIEILADFINEHSKELSNNNS